MEDKTNAILEDKSRLRQFGHLGVHYHEDTDYTKCAEQIS